MLLVDVFEKFRMTLFASYDLHPAHYFTSRDMVWDILLKKTKVNIELLTDIDMHISFENGSCGGLSMVSKRLAEANNQGCPCYGTSKSKSYISYLNANIFTWLGYDATPTC